MKLVPRQLTRDANLKMASTMAKDELKLLPHQAQMQLRLAAELAKLHGVPKQGAVLP
jgi:hypothetical protein